MENADCDQAPQATNAMQCKLIVTVVEIELYEHLLAQHEQDRAKWPNHQCIRHLNALT